MKKLIAVLLFISLAASASAVTMELVYDTMAAGPGGTVNVDIISDTACSGIEGFFVTPYNSSCTIAATGNFAPLFDFVISDSTSDISGITTSSSEYLLPGEAIFSFEVTATSGWNLENPGGVILGYNPDTVVFWDAQAHGHWDDLTIVNIPEPMTVVLLGIGGLFLKSKK